MHCLESKISKLFEVEITYFISKNKYNLVLSIVERIKMKIT